jgi:hypothetical protein
MAEEAEESGGRPTDGCGTVNRGARIEMSEKRWWLIAVAALLAVLMLAGSIGLAVSVGLAAAVGAGILGHRFYRARRPKKGPTVYCLGCGKILPSTARQCKFCGSASWSMKN